jgi:hypothetical protein
MSEWTVGEQGWDRKAQLPRSYWLITATTLRTTLAYETEPLKTLLWFLSDETRSVPFCWLLL